MWSQDVWEILPTAAPGEWTGGHSRWGGVVTTDNTFKTFPVKKEQKKEVAAGGESGVKIETRREGGWVSLLVLRWEILGQRAKD